MTSSASSTFAARAPVKPVLSLTNESVWRSRKLARVERKIARTGQVTSRTMTEEVSLMMSPDEWQLQAARTILYRLEAARAPLAAGELYATSGNDVVQVRRGALLRKLVALGLAQRCSGRGRATFLYEIVPDRRESVAELLVSDDPAALARVLWAASPTEPVDGTSTQQEGVTEPAPGAGAPDVMTLLAERLGQFVTVLERIDARLSKLEDTVDGHVVALAQVASITQHAADQAIAREALMTRAMASRDKDINDTLMTMVRAIKVIATSSIDDAPRATPNVGILSTIAPGGRLSTGREHK